MADADAANTLALKPHVVEAISAVYDPEIPVNIYELGLVYDIVIDAEAVVHVSMTLTSPACPSAQQIPVDVATKIRAIPGVSDADVQIVWEPTWTMEKMSDAARLQLGIGW
jgi:FeS assembly SUF system protein